MKPAIAGLTLFVALVSHLPGQSSRQDDGNTWLGLSRAEKVSFLRGFGTGERTAVLTVCSKLIPKPANCDDKLTGFLERPNATFYQAVDKMDHFYADPINRSIPMWDMIGIVKKAFNGASEAAIEHMLEANRTKGLIAEQPKQIASKPNLIAVRSLGFGQGADRSTITLLRFSGSTAMASCYDAAEAMAAFEKHVSLTPKNAIGLPPGNYMGYLDQGSQPLVVIYRDKNLTSGKATFCSIIQMTSEQ